LVIIFARIFFLPRVGSPGQPLGWASGARVMVSRAVRAGLARFSPRVAGAAFWVYSGVSPIWCQILLEFSVFLTWSSEMVESCPQCEFGVLVL